MVVVFAVGPAVPFVKRVASKGFVAMSTDKVLWVPLLPQRLDPLADDGLAASGAARAETFVVALAVVGPPSMFQKALFPDGPTAPGAPETGCVP